MHYRTMLMLKTRKIVLKHYVILSAILIVVLYVSGFFGHIFQQSFDEFTYPLEEDISIYVNELKEHKKPARDPINKYEYNYLKNPKHKCQNVTSNRLVFVIKSALDHFGRREAIRKTWGFERRFSDVEIRTLFMLGIRDDPAIQGKVDRESSKYNDIIQANFIDMYYNNTIKTIMSYKWLINYCYHSQYYMFVDDDFYVSTKNVLRYLRNPTNYPQYLTDTLKQDITPIDGMRFYSGYCVAASPMRNYFSKWHLSLSEYPYDRFPLYATAGAYILSIDALIDMYYASLYIKHFRFDDVYLGIVALKTGILPYHTKYIFLNKVSYGTARYMYLIASHGYDNSEEMERIWRIQKELGNA